MTQQSRTALVLGATGGLGAELTRQLRAAGWQVRALHRQAAAVRGDSAVEWMAGDAMNPQDVAQAARGCAVIVHAVNPPGYQHWAALALPMLRNTVAAAQALGATIVLPGNVYNYGPDAWPVVHEDSPQQPLTRKGRVRVDMERALEAATRKKGCRAIVVRAGDFFGAGARSNWFAQALAKPGRPVGKVLLPGRPGVPHAWAYLPDVARTMLELIERRDALPAFASFHMAGHVDEDGLAMARAIQRVMQAHGFQAPQLAAFPWRLMRAAALFMALPRELMEMRYLWEQDVRLSSARLLSALGYEPHTPLDEAVEATLLSLHCLGDQGRSPRASRAAMSSSTGASSATESIT